MRAQKVLLIPAILAFGIAGPILAGTAMSATATATASHATSHVEAASFSSDPNLVYHA
jgi:hypothetical protein